MKRRILMIAGGTGGHIFPALAVAAELEKKGDTIYWLGARHGLEAKLVPDKYHLHQLSIRGLRRAGMTAKLLFPWRLCYAIVKAYQFIKQLQPDVVIAMGGYVAGPGGVAARLIGKPLVIHEQNAIAGLTNRCLAKIATKRFQAFDGVFAQQASTVGNPVRAALLAAPLPEQRYRAGNTAALKLLILGGSQGARPINQCLQAVWQDWPLTSHLQVWHQCGEQDYPALNAVCNALPLDIRLQAFIDDIAAAYAWADLIICRSGAMTISEIAAVGVASILVPYPYAADNHQYANARYLSRNNAAILLPQQQMTPPAVFALLQQYINDRQPLLDMAKAAKAVACCDAATVIANSV